MLLRGGEDLSRCDITEIRGDGNADVNLDRVSYISSVAVCSCVVHTAACSCTHTHNLVFVTYKDPVMIKVLFLDA